MANRPSLTGLMATSVTAQSLGGALAIIWLAFNHITPANGIDPKAFEEALALVFSTGLSIIAMFLHIVIYLLLNKYFPQSGENQ